MKPIIKSAGSKTRLLPELLARMPAKWNRYYEPFVGGGSLFFQLAPENAVLGDLSSDLVNVYRTVVDNLPSMIRGLRRHARAYAEDAARAYYSLRDAWNTDRTSWSAPRAAAAYTFLSKTMWNGLWRTNRSNCLNTPMGRYSKPAICEPERLRAAQAMLSRVDLRVGDYRETVKDATSHDFIFFDPPYDPVSPTASFTAFTSSPFGRDQQRELAETARGLVARGCHVLISNSDTSFIRALYKGFKIDQVKCPRRINSNPAGRGDVDELIIVGSPAR